MKKFITVLISLILILTIIVGCTPKKTTPPAAPPANETPGKNQEPSTTKPPANNNTGKDTGAFTDGTFKADGEPDERGWKGTIEVTVVDGEITDVTYDEENKEGKLKSKDEEYGKAMSDQSGVKPAEVYPKLENSLKDTQDPDKVEKVSGATESSNQFIKLAKEALEKKP